MYFMMDNVYYGEFKNNKSVLDMNAFDKHRKSVTAWCEDCDSVFDTRWHANEHQEEKSHRVKVMEFWITGRR
jgi:hypothetical protein